MKWDCGHVVDHWSPSVLLELLLRDWVTTVLSQGSGDHTASVHIHLCIDQKRAIHILDHIRPGSSNPWTPWSSIGALMGTTECVAGKMKRLEKIWPKFKWTVKNSPLEQAEYYTLGDIKLWASSMHKPVYLLTSGAGDMSYLGDLIIKLRAKRVWVQQTNL